MYCKATWSLALDTCKAQREKMYLWPSATIAHMIISALSVWRNMGSFAFWWSPRNDSDQGPVVQSVFSLTSSLRVISLTDLADSIYNILIFFAEKNVSSFCTLQKLLTFFSKKVQHICISLDVNFNDSLTNDIVSFEQLGPD